MWRLFHWRRLIGLGGGGMLGLDPGRELWSLLFRGGLGSGQELMNCPFGLYLSLIPDIMMFLDGLRWYDDT